MRIYIYIYIYVYVYRNQTCPIYIYRYIPTPCTPKQNHRRYIINPYMGVHEEGGSGDSGKKLFQEIWKKKVPPPHLTFFSKSGGSLVAVWKKKASWGGGTFFFPNFLEKLFFPESPDPPLVPFCWFSIYEYIYIYI